MRQWPKGRRFLLVKMGRSKGLGFLDITNKVALFRFKLPLIRYDEDRRGGGILFIGFGAHDRLFGKELYQEFWQSLCFWVLVSVHHFIGHIAMGQHLRNAHLAP